MLLKDKMAKPKQFGRRSRKGCKECKRQKKKCDETRPCCEHCTLAKTPCVYNLPERSVRTPKPSKHVSSVSGYSLLGNDIRSNELLEVCGVGISSDSMTAAASSSLDHGRLLSPFSPPASSSLPLSSSVSLFLDETLIAETLHSFYGLQTDMISEDPAYSTVELDPCWTDLSFPLNIQEPRGSSFLNSYGSLSHHKLIDHFRYALAPMMTLDSRHRNQLVQLVLPLTSVNPTVFNAVCAVAGAHLEQLDHVGIYMSPYYRRLTTRDVECPSSETTGDGQVGILTSILLLVYYEAVLGTSNKSASLIDGYLRKAFQMMAIRPQDRVSSSIDFLEKAFQFYDLVTAFSLGKKPISSIALRRSSNNSLLSTASDLTQASLPVDPHLGLAKTLWPVCYLVGHAVSSRGLFDHVMTTKPSNVPAYEAGFSIMASTITSLLVTWEPPSVIAESTRPEDFEGKSESYGSVEWFSDCIECLSQGALAFRHSVLVFFDKIVLRYSREFPRIQENVHLALTYCAAAVHSGGPLNGLLWPLTIASREAITDEDKDLATLSFKVLKARRTFGNVDRAWMSVLFTWHELESSSFREVQWEVVGGLARPELDLILV